MRTRLLASCCVTVSGSRCSRHLAFPQRLTNDLPRNNILHVRTRTRYSARTNTNIVLSNRVIMLFNAAHLMIALLPVCIQMPCTVSVCALTVYTGGSYHGHIQFSRSFQLAVRLSSQDLTCSKCLTVDTLP